MNKLLLALISLSIMIIQINAQTISPQDITQKIGSEDLLLESVSQVTKTNLPVKQQQNPYVRPEAKERFNRYLNRTIGTGLIGVGFSSAIQQISNEPPEWGKTGKGFARRFGSNLGERAIQETVSYGLEEALKLDSKFYRSEKRNLSARVKNAFLSSFTARTTSGKRVFNPSRIVGAYSANFISTAAWYPKRFSYKDGFRQGSQSIGFNIGFGFLNEFIFKRK